MLDIRPGKASKILGGMSS